jgi:hypothetical protein
MRVVLRGLLIVLATLAGAMVGLALVILALILGVGS